MTDDNNLVIHTNQLEKKHLNSVRRALQWYSDNISHLHNIHLLQLRTRIPAKALCISAAESIFREQYYEAHAHLSNWKDLLGLPLCNTWIHEGSAKSELKSICREHKFQYLITTEDVANQLQSSGYFWHRHAFDVVERFGPCVLVSVYKRQTNLQQEHSTLSYAANY